MTPSPLPNLGPPRSQAAGVGEVESGVERLINSRQRMKAHGEVFTPRRMVDEMLNLVHVELESGPQFVDKT